MMGTTGRHARRTRYTATVFMMGAALTLGAWGWSPAGRASDEETFVATYQAASAARKAVAKAGYEWRDTKKLLREARKLAKGGKFAEAVELANIAKRQSELALVQAEEQESASKSAVLQ